MMDSVNEVNTVTKKITNYAKEGETSNSRRADCGGLQCAKTFELGLQI